MKRIATALICVMATLSISACADKTAEVAMSQQQSEAPVMKQTENMPAAEESMRTFVTEPAPAQTAEPASSTLVVYFSRVGNTDFPDDIDAVSSATLSRSGSVLKGNAQLIAEWMADEAGAELFEIQTERTYPVDYAETTDVAKQEQNANARPALKTSPGLLDGYSTVYLVFPNWWGDLPMALYSFFDEYDFSGKTIYVSITHEGSGFSRTVNTVQDLEPNATVVEGISIRGGSVTGAEDTVRQFIRDNR